MLVGRFAPAIAVLAIAGSLAAKKHYQITSATLPTHKPAFIIWLIFVILLIGVITFFSLLAVGPFVEHLIMTQGGTF
jgi:K+-transporting ATPase ATPase A chain